MTMTAPTVRPIGAPGVEPRRLENFVMGEWAPGTGRMTDLFHAVTGDKIAETSTGGVDFAGMVDYARRVGGPALRTMTFHERALMLKSDQSMKWGRMRAAFFDLQDIGFKGVLLKVTEKKKPGQGGGGA